MSITLAKGDSSRESDSLLRLPLTQVVVRNGAEQQPEEFNSVSFEATPVTAKHNLESYDDEQYLRTTVKFTNGHETDITMPEGGCILEGGEEIEVRAATEDSLTLTWYAQDVLFGTKLINASNSLSKKPRIFEKVPESFVLQIGLKIGMAVFRTFEITHGDAKAPSNVVLEDFMGKSSKLVFTLEK